MSNNLRTRNGMPFNFVNGLKVRGMDIESLIPGIEGIPEAGSKYQFAGNGSNKGFTLPVTPYNKDAVDVYVKQLYVHPDDYTLVGDTVTLTEAPPAVMAGETYNVVIKVSLTTLNGYVNANRVSFEGENLDDILEKGKPIANYPALRAYAGAATQVRITDPGIAGFFYYDPLDAVSADNGGTVIVSGNGKRWKRFYDTTVSVSWFAGVISNATSDASAAAQLVATLCDSNKKRYLYIPNWDGEFKWINPVTFINPGVRIFGDQSATYNRGGGKEGWLVGQAGLSRFLDLGGSRTTGNPADQWQVDGLSFKQATGVASRSIDGISFTSRTNGPDRGAAIRDCSFVGLKDAITVENPDVSVSIANLNVEGCVFQGCDAAINAKGRMFGLRFVNNQCEQNAGSNGVIRGSIDGAINISDNMLEGQKDTISIDIPPTFGNRPQLRSEGNYLELNSGDYVYRFRVTTSVSSFKIGPNYALNINASDYILIQNSAGTMFLDVHDEYPVCFDNSAVSLKYGSNILRKRSRNYRVRRVSAGKPAEIIISDYVNLIDNDNSHVHTLPRVGTVLPTPQGNMICATGTSFVTVPLAVTIGDLISLNILCQASVVTAGNLSVSIFDQTGTVKVGEWGGSSIAEELSGKWALVSVAFIATQTASSIRVRFYPVSGAYSTAISGIAAKNHGPHTNDGATYKSITPVVPKVQNIEATLTVDIPALAIGAGYTQEIPCIGASVGDFVVASLPTDLADVQVTAWVSAIDTIKVRFQNQSTVGSRDFASTILRVRVIR